MRLSWSDRRMYSLGLDRGVYFPQNGDGEAWNGLVSVNEAATDGASNVRYRDGVKYVNNRTEDSFAATIEAYTYPEGILSGKPFGFSYRVLTAEGYRTHLVYNALAVSSERTYAQDEASAFSFDISTKPIPIPGVKPSAHLIIDTEQAYSWTVAAFEELLYGSDSSSSRLPLPDEVIDIFEVNSIVRIIDNGDGTWTATGPDDVIQMLDPTTLEIDWPTAVYIDEVSYRISSL